MFVFLSVCLVHLPHKLIDCFNLQDPLSLIDPLDGIVTELDDHCDKLQRSSVEAGGIVNIVDSLLRSERPLFSS